MEKKQRITVSLLLILCMFIAFVSPVFAQFSDIKDHWAEDEIVAAYEDGVAKGYPRGSFGPDDPITRAQFCALANRILGFTEVSEESFTDVLENSWYYSDVLIAVQAGYMVGFEDGTFRPESEIRREDAVLMASQLLDFEPNMEEAEKYTDLNDLSEESKGAIGAVLAAEYMRVYEDGTFRPNDSITRAETIVLLRRIKRALDAPPLVAIEWARATNGKINIDFSAEVNGLTAEDFVISATVNSSPYDINNLSFNSDDNTFTFSALNRKSNDQRLIISVAASPTSTKITGADDAVVRVDGYGAPNPAPPQEEEEGILVWMKDKSVDRQNYYYIRWEGPFEFTLGADGEGPRTITIHDLYSKKDKGQGEKVEYGDVTFTERDTDSDRWEFTADLELIDNALWGPRFWLEVYESETELSIKLQNDSKVELHLFNPLDDYCNLLYLWDMSGEGFWDYVALDDEYELPTEFQDCEDSPPVAIDWGDAVVDTSEVGVYEINGQVVGHDIVVTWIVSVYDPEDH